MYFHLGETMKSSHVNLALILSLALVPMFSFQNCAPNKITFSNAGSKITEASIRQFKPSLAVRDVSCLLCHASIKGNLVTELGIDSNKKAGLHNLDGGHSDYLWADLTTYGALNFLSTTNIQGEISLPYGELTAAAQAKATEMIGIYKTNKIATSKVNTIVPQADLADDYFFQSNAPERPVTTAQYLDAMLNYRTSGYMDAINKIRNVHKFSPALVSVAVKTKINQISTVEISGAAASDIGGILQGARLIYMPAKTGARLTTVRNLLDKGTFFTNADSQAIDCDGDIFTNLPLYFSNLIVQTDTGCRIHSTRSIFINASLVNGLRFLNKKPESNLQLSSSHIISMGLGYCKPLKDENGNVRKDEEGNDVYNDHPHAGPNGSFNRRGLMSNAEFTKDLTAITNVLGKDQLQDSANCGNRLTSSRTVSFERLLINASQIHSRYTGNYKGIIISPFVMWSLGEFSFEYDTTFDLEAVQIFPRLNTPIFQAKE